MQQVDPTTATQADIEGYLVGLACPCTECGYAERPGGPHKPTCDCNATGLRFPLTQECPCIDQEWEGHVGEICKCELALNNDGSVGETNQRGACWNCRMSGHHLFNCSHEWCNDERCTDGRVAAVTVFGLLDALRGMGAKVHIGTAGLVYTLAPPPWPWTTEAELINALERILVAAVVAQEGD